MQAAGIDEVAEEGEGAALGEVEVGLELAAEEAGMGGEMGGEEGGELGVGDVGATGLQDVLEAGLAVDGLQQFGIGTELDAADAEVVDAGADTAARSDVLHVALDVGLEGAEVFNGDGRALGQQLCQSASQQSEGSDVGAGGEDGIYFVHRMRELTVINGLEVNGSQVSRGWLPVLPRRILMYAVFDHDGE